MFKQHDDGQDREGGLALFVILFVALLVALMLESKHSQKIDIKPEPVGSARVK